MLRFDAYTATIQGLRPSDFVDQLADFGRGDKVKGGRGFQTFGERLSVYDDSGSQVGAVQWGGLQGERVMCEVKGERTPRMVEWLRQHSHRCTRVDSCVDFERPGIFDELREVVEGVRGRHGIYRQNLGDWDQPELGRTVMLGASSSAVRGRLYEKGKQPELRHLRRPDLVRIEVQVRPQKEARQVYSQLSALEVWGASRWTRELAAEVLHERIDARPAGAVWRESQRDRALRFMARQYGAHLVSLAADLGGWEVLGLTLGEMIREDRAERGKS